MVSSSGFIVSTWHVDVVEVTFETSVSRQAIALLVTTKLDQKKYSKQQQNKPKLTLIMCVCVHILSCTRVHATARNSCDIVACM